MPTPLRTATPPAQDARNRGNLHDRGCQGARHPQLRRSPPHCSPDDPPPPRTATPPWTKRATADICTIADARAPGIRNYADLRHGAARVPHPHRARHPPLRRSPHQPGCPTPPQAQLRTSALSRMPGRQTSAIEQISATVQPGCPPRAATPPCTTRATADIYTVADARARGIRNYADLRSSAAQAPRRARRGVGGARNPQKRANSAPERSFGCGVRDFLRRTRDRPGHAPARAYRPCQAGLLAKA